jgi:hypothetical protein
MRLSLIMLIYALSEARHPCMRRQFGPTKHLPYSEFVVRRSDRSDEAGLFSGTFCVTSGQLAHGCSILTLLCSSWSLPLNSVLKVGFL